MVLSNLALVKFLTILIIKETDCKHIAQNTAHTTHYTVCDKDWSLDYTNMEREKIQKKSDYKKQIGPSELLSFIKLPL